MKPYKGKILIKLLFYVIPVSILSLLITTGISNYYMTKIVNSYVPSANIKTAEIVRLKVSDFFNEAKVSLETIGDVLIDERYSNKRQYLLRQTMLKNSFFEYIDMVDVNGTEIANTNVDNSLGMFERTEVLGTVFEGNVSFSDVYLADNEIPTIAICVPCKKWRRVDSAICGKIDFRSIWNLMDSVKLGKTGYSTLVTSEGRYLSHPDKTKVLKQESISNIEISAISNKEGSYYVKNDVDVLATFSTVRGNNWKVVVMQDKNEVFADYILMKRYSIIATSLLTILTGILLIIFSRNITKPIEKLKEATERISSGALNCSLDLTSGDEIGALARSFDKMMNDVKKHQKMLVQTEKLSSLGRFSASVAHEIQNPISGLLGYAYLLKKHTDPKVVEFGMDIEEELNNIQSVIGSLLALSRQTDYEFEDVNLNNVILKSVELLDHHFSRFKKVEIKSELDDAIPKIRGNKILLQQALLNIVLNSGEALNENGVVVISSISYNGKVEIKVSDNGPGIAENDKEKLFEPFFTTKHGTGGTGLGLYITNEIMKLHQGFIEVISHENVGTDFKLTFITQH